MEDRTEAGRKLRILTVEDEFTRTCLAIEVEHRMNARFVTDTLMGLIAEPARRVPEHGDVLQPGPGEDDLQGVRTGLQHVAPAQQPGKPDAQGVCRIPPAQASGRHAGRLARTELGGSAPEPPGFIALSAPGCLGKEKRVEQSCPTREP